MNIIKIVLEILKKNQEQQREGPNGLQYTQFLEYVSN